MIGVFPPTWEVGAQFTKKSFANRIKCPDMHRIFPSPYSSLEWWWGGESIPPQIVFPRNWTKEQDLYRKLIFTKSHPSMGVGGSIDKYIFFTKNCMKYPDLHTEVLFTYSHPLCSGVEVIFYSNVFARNWVKCWDLYRKLMFGHLQIGKGWGTAY